LGGGETIRNKRRKCTRPSGTYNADRTNIESETHGRSRTQRRGEGYAREGVAIGTESTQSHPMAVQHVEAVLKKKGE